MAASRTPATAESEPCIAVAYSAGRDSTALLHATARAAVEQGVSVVALHVHHGLSAHADDWWVHAQTQCARWAQQGLPVRLMGRRLEGQPAVGDSVEAWARRERYRALREMAIEAGASTVLLAHHRRDQAETLLLQGLRGAGVAGLAGMPQQIERDGICWERPWLGQARTAIEAYVRHHRLKYIDDDSNTDARFARNRLRLEVWPALSAAFPQAESSLADAASWAAQAAACLAELAAIDLEQVSDEQGLVLAAWRGLSAARQTNTLRAWIRERAATTASAVLVRRLQAELTDARSGSWEVPGGLLRLYRGRLLYVAAAPVPIEIDTSLEDALSIAGPSRYALPGWGGVLVATRVMQGGVPDAWLQRLELRPRTGGEKFMAGIGRPARGLKKQYQSAQVPEWLRDGPLVYSGGQLVFVPGLGMDARLQAMPGQSQLRLDWQRG